MDHRHIWNWQKYVRKLLFKKFKKKYPSTIFFDGDQFRSIFFNDINYTLKDRDTNAIRLTNLVKYISSQKVNIIISANLTSQRFRDWCKETLKIILRFL